VLKKTFDGIFCSNLATMPEKSLGQAFRTTRLPKWHLKVKLGQIFSFLADRTNGRTYATVLRLSVVVCRL